MDLHLNHAQQRRKDKIRKQDRYQSREKNATNESESEEAEVEEAAALLCKAVTMSPDE